MAIDSNTMNGNVVERGVMRRVATWRVAGICAGLMVLLIWQVEVFRVDWPDTHMMEASTGLRSQARFAYFLYYQNLFPVASTQGGRNWEFYFNDEEHPQEPDLLDYSAGGSERLLAESGDSLVMEWAHSIRGGGLLQTYLYLPDAWRLGSPQFAEVRIGNGLLFLLGLVAILVSFWWTRSAVLGVTLVLLIGSSPFQIFEAYRRENVLSWPITTFCFVLAACWPFIVQRRLSRTYQIVAPLAIGAILAGTMQIRPETVAIFGGALFVFLTASSLSWQRRGVLVALMFGAFGMGLQTWNQYFDAKIASSSDAVARAGGHPLPATRDRYHQLWTSLWCGLGDFDTKYGYAWNDSAAIRYAQPILLDQYDVDLPWWWGVEGKDNAPRTASDYEDAARLYYKLPFGVPHFQEVMRDKVFHDILHDPIWYAGILARRTARVLNHTSPLALTAGASFRPLQLHIPFSGWLVFPILVIAVWFRRWTVARLILFSLPMSAVPLLLYSGRNTTYYSMYHVCAAAICAAWLFEIAWPPTRRLWESRADRAMSFRHLLREWRS